MSQFFSDSDSNSIITVFNNLIRIALYVLMIVSMCKIFQKANEEWWKAIIPFYGTYVEYRIAGKKKLFWVQLIVSTVSVIIGFILIIASLTGMITTSFNSGRDSIRATDGVYILMLFSAMLIIIVPTFVINAIKCVGLARSFGLSGGFAAGLILLPYVFYPILAFGKSQYVGEGYGYYPMNQYPQNYYNNQYPQDYYNNQYPQQYPQQYQQPYYDPNQSQSQYYVQNQYNSYNQYQQNPNVQNQQDETIDLNQNPYK